MAEALGSLRPLYSKFFSIICWCVGVARGYDGHRGWLYSVAVMPSHQRIGLGTAMVRAMLRQLRELGCCKINLQVLSLDMALVTSYRALGYQIEQRISMGRRLG